jgi:Protein of unknown function (DUF2892)
LLKLEKEGGNSTMKVSQNIGIINALIRITCGLTILTWVTAKLVKRPWRDSYLLMAMLAAMKVGEGILRYCPVTDLLDNNLGGKGKKSSNEKDSSSDGLGMFNLNNVLNKNSDKEDNKDSNKDREKDSNKQQDFNPENFTNAEVQAALSGKTDQNQQQQDTSNL